MVAEMPPEGDVAALACSPTDPSFVVSSASGPAKSGGAAAAGSSGGTSQAVGRLALWNMRAFKRTGLFAMPGDALVGSLSYAAGGGLIVAGSAGGRVAVFEGGGRPQPVRSWSVGREGSEGGAGVQVRRRGRRACGACGEERQCA